ncbi:unnamed protein product [Prorocentrum cordatum]|uniref:Ubiquitinyl hydrolase 1 n=1 Tax=Prorocentrum cordatum TaxID=2364126 RepID=A0ABN9T8K3_9DINO|nr:unnamed protein product [Polarella glacialis]
MCAWEGPRDERPRVVTSSTKHAVVVWWSMVGSKLCFDGVSEMPDHSGGVISLSSFFELVMSCHVGGSLVQWHGLSRTCIRRIQSSTVCSCSLAMVNDKVVLAQAFATKGRGNYSSIHFAAFAHLRQEEGVQVVKEPKKEKAAKMFAHKSRGGRKNFECKKTGRHTS